MSSDKVIAWGLLGVFLFAGVGFLLAKVDERQLQLLETLNRFFPATRLYQFRIFRYGVAVAFFIMAGVVYIGLLT